MSNNDLYCSKCKSQHHPVECPLDEMNLKERTRETLEVFKVAVIFLVSALSWVWTGKEFK